jgi:hypothetical protein
MESPVIVLSTAKYKGEDSIFFHGIRDFDPAFTTMTATDGFWMFCKDNDEALPFPTGTQTVDLNEETELVLKDAGLDNADVFTLGQLSVKYEGKPLYDIRDYFDKAAAKHNGE